MQLSKKIATIGVFLISAILAGGLASRLTPVLATPEGFGSEELHHASHTMPMSIFGQFRTNLSAYMWLKTTEYLHGGITYRPHSRAERERGMRGHKASVGGFAEHDCGGPTMIPSKESDWRGMLGDLERNLQPYRPGPARHGDPEQLIPWYRIQTIINPLDINAYVTCAFFLADFSKKSDKALAFLEEGIKNNPDSPVLHEAAGRLYFEKWKNYDEAIPYLQRAIAVGKEISDRDKKQEKAFNDAYLFLARAYRKKGDLDSALRISEQGMADCPDYNFVRIINRIIKRDIEDEASGATSANGTRSDAMGR